VYKSKIIAGVEIGTSKVAVLLGEIEEGRSLNIIGMGQCSSRGVQKGEVFDFHEASDCAHAAIQAAENQAGVAIDGVYLALSGSHISGYASEASISVTSEDGKVTSDDVNQLMATAQAKELPENRAVIHHLKRPYKLDGRIVDNPVNLEGERLEASCWTVHGDARKMSDAIHIINGLNLHVDDVVLAALASSAVVATADEKRNGSLVIDIGRGSTDFAMYSNGCCVNAGSLPIGGDHISNDLSIGLRMRLKQAESLKVRYGSAQLKRSDRSERVWLNNDLEIGDRTMPLWSIEKIVELRVSEIFEVVKKRLGAYGMSEKLSGGVILCGGSAQLKNIDDCAEKVFGVPARVGDNGSMATDELKEPAYSTPLGLLYYGLQFQSKRNGVSQRGAGLFGKLKSLLK